MDHWTADDWVHQQHHSTIHTRRAYPSYSWLLWVIPHIILFESCRVTQHPCCHSTSLYYIYASTSWCWYLFHHQVFMETRVGKGTEWVVWWKTTYTATIIIAEPCNRAVIAHPTAYQISSNQPHIQTSMVRCVQLHWSTSTIDIYLFCPQLQHRSAPITHHHQPLSVQCTALFHITGLILNINLRPNDCSFPSIMTRLIPIPCPHLQSQPHLPPPYQFQWFLHLFCFLPSLYVTCVTDPAHIIAFVAAPPYPIAFNVSH